MTYYTERLTLRLAYPADYDAGCAAAEDIIRRGWDCDDDDDTLSGERRKAWQAGFEDTLEDHYKTAAAPGPRPYSIADEGDNWLDPREEYR